MAPIVSDTIRRCDFVGIGVEFLEEVCHFGVGFEIFAHTVFSVTCMLPLPVDQDVQVSFLLHHPICPNATTMTTMD